MSYNFDKSNFEAYPHPRICYGCHGNMRFHISQTDLFLRTALFLIFGVLINNLAPMKNCPGWLHGNLNWLPCYLWKREFHFFFLAILTSQQRHKVTLNQKASDVYVYLKRSLFCFVYSLAGIEENI